MPYSILASDLSLSLTFQQVMTIVFGAGKLAEVDTVLKIDLPAGHGGVQLNWLLPATNWPFYGFSQRWNVARDDAVDRGGLIDSQPVASPTNSDWAPILPPSADPGVYVVTAIHAFKSPAGGGTLSLQAATIAAGNAPIIRTNTSMHLATYAWFELQ